MVEKLPFEPLLNALAPQPPKPDDPKAYYAQLGRFITSFAAAEAAVHMLARKLSGIDDGKARIIFNELRLPKLSDRVRGMLRIDKAGSNTFAEIDSCLSQLSKIADRRHRIVQSRPQESEQDDKWSFCLTAGTLCPANQERQ